MNAPWIVIPAAFALDALLGDPEGWPHPVRWMGRAIERWETVFRSLPLSEVTAGGLMSVTLVLLAWTLPITLLTGLDAIHPVAGFLARLLLLASCISVRSLYEAAMTVHRHLAGGDLEAARSAVGMIVGRDTGALDTTGVSRATVETVGENLVDGVLSPLFFAVIGGVPLAMAYKMVNTLDSMIGYKNDRYRQFGKVAARMDDAANYLPARLSLAVIAVAAWMLGADGRRAWRTGIAEGRRHTSPNAGYPEAAFSGALSVSLGGPGVYHGRRVEKPVIGSGRPCATPGHIPRACRLMVTASMVAAVLAAVLTFLSGVY